ncbi:unnamed protein product [Enterobius vermicularis]|uniref:Glutathione S-transferase 1 n=1 Tax=Enterobius vermicularis TaxID=51028 RepID=A0A0N4V4F1_ENTVE|nr:unnamed protein product [Enterobius vermicularis]
MPQYKLTYFDLRGLAEGARLMFHYAGVPFEDVRITREQWPQIKPTTPFGQVPVLSVDGHEIAQSAAIYRYLGRQFNLVPKCPIEEAMVDAIYDAHKDFYNEVKDFIIVVAGFKEGDKDKLLKEVFLPGRDKYFGYLKKHLEKSDGIHLIGKVLTWADIAIAGNLYTMQGFAPSLFDGFPEVKKLQKLTFIVMMPQYKLVYFNLRGLGEGARLLFHYAGVPFQDVRIPLEQWKDIKPCLLYKLFSLSSTPFGQLPVLHVDGKQIAQSAAIYRYLGRQFKLVPSCAIEEALVDAVYDAFKDFHNEILPYFVVAAGFVKGDKEKLLNDVLHPAKKNYFGFLKQHLARSDGIHLVGKSVSWADIVIAENLHVIQGLAPSLFDEHSEVKKFSDEIYKLPTLQKYLNERPFLAT